MIPIGYVDYSGSYFLWLRVNRGYMAYQPRDFMSPVHCSPRDSVALFKDIRGKKALGMHWG